MQFIIRLDAPLAQRSLVNSRILAILISLPPGSRKTLEAIDAISLAPSEHHSYKISSAPRGVSDSIEERRVAFKLHSRRYRRAEDKKKAVRFRRNGITCGEKRKRDGRDIGRDRRRKTGGSAPAEFFGQALPIYILRRIYPRMCMFLISWMHATFTRTRGC